MPQPSLKFDTSEVAELADIMVDVAGVPPKELRKVVARSALNIKTDARRRITGHPHAKAYPSSITYDSHETPNGGWAEIGPDKQRRQGALGNLLEYGSVNNPPLPHMLPAAEAEAPKFRKAIEDLAVKALNAG